MASLRSSGEHSGSLQSHHSSPKTSLQNKNDPNLALHEAQPIGVSNSQPLSQDLAFSLRSIQHLDRNGQVISDPDRSNPTRSRLERPLDTIRNFEAAIDANRRQR